MEMIDNDKCLEINIKIIIEKAKGNYSAYCPNYPGWVATGDTIRECKLNMFSSLCLHLMGEK